VLGIEVDANNLLFALPKESKERLEKELEEWGQKGVWKRVKEWQQLAGWINWSFNIFPLLWPALNNIYLKLKGKTQEAKVWANTAIREDLSWAREKMKQSSGVLVLKSLSWEIDEAMCTLETDACPKGFAYWYLSSKEGFVTAMPAGTPSTSIIFYESMAVLSVLHDAHLRLPSGCKIVIYTNNFTTVSMFNSLRVLPEYNCIIKAAIDILLEGNHNLRVLHISGDNNAVANVLSRSQFMRALVLQPEIRICAFQPYVRVDRRQLPPMLQPPRETLGVELS